VLEFAEGWGRACFTPQHIALLVAAAGNFVLINALVWLEVVSDDDISVCGPLGVLQQQHGNSSENFSLLLT
jgi:hypothetical protein